MNTNMSSDWSGEEVSLHEHAPQPVQQSRHKKKKHINASVDRSANESDALVIATQAEQAQDDSDEGALYGVEGIESSVVPVMVEENTDNFSRQDESFMQDEENTPAPTLTTASQSVEPRTNVVQNVATTADSDIKRAFMEALAAPLPNNADQQLVQQVESARKILGVETYSSAPEGSIGMQPPVFDRSEDMKAAFTKALGSTQIPVGEQNLTLKPQYAVSASFEESQTESTPIVNKESRHKRQKPQFKQKPQKPTEEVPEVLATVTPVVIAPSGSPVVQEVKRPHSISKFADKPTLQSGGWQGEGADKEEVVTVPADQTSQKPFTIDEVASSTNGFIKVEAILDQWYNTVTYQLY